MEKLKIYVTPSVEILVCAPQAMMKTGSDLPPGPGPLPDPSPAPAREKVF